MASIEPDNDNQDVTVCKKFIEDTCGCTLAKGSPCSATFPLEHYVTHPMQAAELTHNELDLEILGSLMSIINTGNNTGNNIKDGAHKPVKRKRTFLSFQHNGYQVCQVTYRFLFGIGKHRLKAIKAHYLSHGMTVRAHGNAGKLPHNVT